MIKIKGLCKTFGDRPVLKGIDLQIEKGKVIAIIGPSGTGKSTLLRCLNMLEKADSGEVEIAGNIVDFTKLKKMDTKMLRKKTAMVFQNSNLYRNKTAIENITEVLMNSSKMKNDEAITIAESFLEKVGMLHKKNVYPETLSGGEKQRVGIARAMSVNPDILLFDEPTSSLDPELVIEVLEVIKDLAKNDTTMLIVTHEMEFAREVADEVIFMENGYIVERAPTDIFFTNPQNERSKEFIKMKVDQNQFENIDFDERVDRRYTNSYKWKDLKKSDTDMEVYPMWVADMEFKTPKGVLDSITARVNEGVLGYDTLSSEYYETVVYWLEHRHSYSVKPKDVVYCANSMIGLSVFLQAFTTKGDEVLINSPVYGNFFKTIEGCGRKVLESPLEEKDSRFTLNFSDMEKRITDKTKILLLCNPQNPTGTVWTKEELEKICMFCKKYNLYLISDEIHYEFIFNDAKHIVTDLIAKEMSMEAVTIISPSKSFNMAGSQSASIIIKNEKMRSQFEQVMSSMDYPFTHAFAEPATIGAYRKSEKWLDEAIKYIGENRKYFIDFVEKRIPLLKVTKSDSTYLMWVDCSGLQLSSVDLEKLWRDDCKIILSNGNEFGTYYEQYRRFNIACPKGKLVEIMERIENIFTEKRLIGEIV